jgi:hypothetical protein
VEKEGSSSSSVDAEQSRVRHWQLLQIGGRAGENKRGKWGGRLGIVWSKENGRERGPRAWRLAAQTTGSGWLSAARLEAAVHAHGGGRLVNRGGRRGAGDAVRRD